MEIPTNCRSWFDRLSGLVLGNWVKLGGFFWLWMPSASSARGLSGKIQTSKMLIGCWHLSKVFGFAALFAS